MGNYRKLIVAIVGIVLLYVNRRWGVDLFGADEHIVEIVVSIGTAFSVWLFPNTKAQS